MQDQEMTEMQDRKIELRAGHWILLPGTGFEVLLHGSQTTIKITRRPDGKWNLPKNCYVRRV